SLWEAKPDRWDNAMVLFGAVGAAALVGIDAFAISELIGGRDRADEGLIRLGIGVGLAFAAFTHTRHESSSNCGVASSSPQLRWTSSRTYAGCTTYEFDYNPKPRSRGRREGPALPRCVRLERFRGRGGLAHEEEWVSERKVTIADDRREDQGARRLAGQDARPGPHVDQASRPRGGRGVEVERGSSMVSRRIDLHRRDLQERREDDLCQGGRTRGPIRPLQLRPRGQHQACHRLPREREDPREGIEGACSRGRGAERVPRPRLIDVREQDATSSPVLGFRRWERIRSRCSSRWPSAWSAWSATTSSSSPARMGNRYGRGRFILASRSTPRRRSAGCS